MSTKYKPTFLILFVILGVASGQLLTDNQMHEIDHSSDIVMSGFSSNSQLQINDDYTTIIQQMMSLAIVQHLMIMINVSQTIMDQHA